MSGSKAPDFDAYGLFRATHSHIGAGHKYLINTLLTFTFEMIKYVGEKKLQARCLRDVL